MTNQIFTITKKIAKHGRQSVIIIPQMLKQFLEPGQVVEIRIEIIERGIN